MSFKTLEKILFASFILWTSCVGNNVDAVCNGRCERTTTNPSSDALQSHALQGHTIKTLTNNSSHTCHYKCFLECRCLSYQISNAGCELMDEDRSSKPGDFQQKIGYQYYNMRREYYHSKDPHADACLGAPCENECCKSQPCLNSGQCTEFCDNPKLKFNCTCAEGYTGKLCQIKPRSCKDYINNGTNGKYVVFNKDGNKLHVFCDFLSEKGFAWTLVESFTYKNNDLFKAFAFFKDKPLDENNPNWNAYRLSHAHMKEIAEQSNYYRATCQFPSEVTKDSDYLRGKLSDFNLVEDAIERCVKHEYMKIRGHPYYNRTAHTIQTANWHMHLDSYWSSGCELGRVPGAEPGRLPPLLNPPGEDNFGLYDTPNSHHRCSANENAITQWWLGGP